MDIYHNQEYHAKIAVRTASVSIIGNLILSVLKIVAGIFSHSSALVSDGIHSASDLISSAVVVIGMKLSVKEEDADHPYGHERLECAAAIVLSVLLLITGIFIGYQAFSDITSQDSETLEQPGIFLSDSGHSVYSGKRSNVLVYKILCIKNSFRRTDGGCMASPKRFTFFGRGITGNFRSKTRIADA